MSVAISVAQISTFPHGGAGMAACRIHAGLQTTGITSHFYYYDNQSCDFLDSTYYPLNQLLSSQPLSSPLAFLPWVKRAQQRRLDRRSWTVGTNYETYLRDNDRHTEVFSQPELVQETRVIRERFNYQILHLHWTAFALDWPSFFGSLPRQTPIVWTLHDQNPYTGGCHFVTGCERFKLGCGSCPQLQATHATDLSQRAFRVKQAAIANKNVHVVAPSLWMLEQAQQSPIFQNAKSFNHIPYGLDCERLSPSNTHTSSFGQRLLPTILFGAEDLENQRKGVRYAIQAINELAALFYAADTAAGTGGPVQPGCLQPKRLQLWTFGKKLGDESLGLIDPSVVVKQWGFIKDRQLQGQLYRAANVFWLPSLEDNQPQTALEAMACGTPVVGFDVGGVPEIVRHQQTGLIVAARDAAGMARCTYDLLKDPARHARMSVACRKMVQQEYSLARQSAAYVELYQQILDRTRARRNVSSPIPHFVMQPELNPLSGTTSPFSS